MSKRFDSILRGLTIGQIAVLSTMWQTVGQSALELPNVQKFLDAANLVVLGSSQDVFKPGGRSLFWRRLEQPIVLKGEFDPTHVLWYGSTKERFIDQGFWDAGKVHLVFLSHRVDGVFDTAGDEMWALVDLGDGKSGILEICSSSKDILPRKSGSVMPEYGGSEALISTLLTESDEMKRVLAIVNLHRLKAKDRRTRDALVSALRDRSFLVRLFAVQSMEMFRGQEEQIVPLLIEMLKDEYGEVRAESARVLMGFGNRARDALEPLKAALKEDGLAIMQQAIERIETDESAVESGKGNSEGEGRGQDSQGAVP